MLLVIELGSDVMQNIIVCNTKSIIFVTVITIPCKTIWKKKTITKKRSCKSSWSFFTTSIGLAQPHQLANLAGRSTKYKLGYSYSRYSPYKWHIKWPYKWVTVICRDPGSPNLRMVSWTLNTMLKRWFGTPIISWESGWMSRGKSRVFVFEDDIWRRFS